MYCSNVLLIGRRLQWHVTIGQKREYCLAQTKLVMCSCCRHRHHGDMGVLLLRRGDISPALSLTMTFASRTAFRILMGMQAVGYPVSYTAMVGKATSLYLGYTFPRGSCCHLEMKP